jgi:AsmA protein
VTAGTGFKRLGYAVAAIILLGTGALGAMSLLISSERVRELAKTEIRNVTGLELTQRGDAAVSLFPTGSVSFSDVVLGEAGAHEPALAADRLTARLRLLPLFIGRIEIADVSLEQSRIDLTFGSDGRSNWSGLIASLARALGPKADRTDQEASFSEIRMRGGTITMHDSVRGVTETLTGVDLALAWPSISKSFAATGRVVWHGEPIDASISLSDFPLALAGERSGLKIRLTGNPLKLAFEGVMSVRPTLKVDGTLSADSPSLRDTLRWAGQKPLPGGGFGRFALKAKTSISGGTIALTGVNVELDGNTAEGALTFATDGRQTLQGTLAAEDLDLTPYVSSVRLVNANESDWNEIPIVIDGLTGLDLDLRLSAAKIAISRAKLGHTAVTANLRSGKFTLTVGESQAFGGIIKGSLVLATTDIGADIKSQLQFTDVDLDGCLGEMFNIHRIEGRGNLNVALEASGGSILGLAQNINGTASLNGRDGAMLRLNAEQLLMRLMQRPISGAGNFRTGRTPFDKLIVNLKITQGIATIEEARLESPKVRMTLAGSSSIPTREIDLHGQASLFATRANDAAPIFGLAFAVTGLWDDPIPALIPQGLIERSQSAGQLLDAVRRLNAPPPVPAPALADPATDGSNAAPLATPPASPPLATEPVSTAPVPAQPQQ